MACVSGIDWTIGILQDFEDMNFLCQCKTKRNDAKFEETSNETIEERP